MLWKCRPVGTSARNTKRHHQSRPLGSGSPGSKTHLTPFSYVPSGRMTARTSTVTGKICLLENTTEGSTFYSQGSHCCLLFSSSKQTKIYDGLFFVPVCSTKSVQLYWFERLINILFLFFRKPKHFSKVFSFNIKLIRTYIPSTTANCLLLYQHWTGCTASFP